MTTPIEQLLALTDRYCAAVGLTHATVSTRVFNDGKRIEKLRGGGDIGTRVLAGAFRWFSQNWPDNAVWPEGVPRPAAEPEPERRAAVG